MRLAKLLRTNPKHRGARKLMRALEANRPLLDYRGLIESSMIVFRTGEDAASPSRFAFETSEAKRAAFLYTPAHSPSVRR